MALQTSLIVPLRVWTAMAVAQAATLVSSAIPLTRAQRAESIIAQITSVLSAVPSVKIEYAISLDGVTFGPYIELVAASVTDFASAEGLTAVSLPNFLAPWVRFRVTELGVTSDTLVTFVLYLREGP